MFFGVPSDAKALFWRPMRSSFLSILVAAVAAFASPYRILVDRPGQWEFEWVGRDWRTSTHSDGSTILSVPGVPNSDISGDLDAPRLQGLLALPARGEWKLEVVQDSGSVRQGASWHRVPGRRAVAAVDRSAWTERVVDGIRLLRMDYPLTESVAGGVRVRHKLRLKITWTGTASVPAGSPWARGVDNPNGIRKLDAVAPRRFAASRANELGGAMVEVNVATTDPYSSSVDGVARLTGAQLIAAAGVAPGVSFANIAVYSGISDTATIAISDSLVAPGLKLIPIDRVDRNGDNLLDADDEVRFWARGPNIWKRNALSASGWSFTINPYTLSRKYLVRLDAPKASPALASPVVVNSATKHETVGQPVWVGKPDKLKELEIGKSTITEPNMGKSWYWAASEVSGDWELPAVSISLPGKKADSVVAHLVPVQNSWYGASAADFALFGLKGEAVDWAAVDGFDGTWRGVLPSSGTSSFRLNTNGFRSAAAGLQVWYDRDLTKSVSASFPSPQTGSVSIAVPEANECWVLEDGFATRRCSVVSGRLLDSATREDTWYAFFPKDASGAKVTLSKWLPASQKHVVRDFSTARSADVLVVVPAEFADIAEEYAVHREDKSFQVRPMNVAIARTDDIFALWSGGQMDPVAIRDCIRWAHVNWGVSHVLLLGGGHFDPRRVSAEAPAVRIPHWEEHSVSTDDLYTFLEPGNPATDADLHTQAVAVGRIPAWSTAEARAWLDKLKVFESPSKAVYGPWRNTIVLTADDVWQLRKPDEIPNHTLQSEEIGALLNGVRPWVRQEKLYLAKYPSNSLFQKPEAARDLQTLLNRGVVGMNYMGHGGQTILADEDLLDNAMVDRTLVNKDRPFLFYAGSCTVGRNDLPDSKGLSEFLVVAPNKGAMAAIAGTRPSYPGGNARLSGQFWAQVADTSKFVTIGEALVRSKAINDENLDGIYHNSDIYNILGDPAMVLLPGGLPVSVAGLPDTLSALAKVDVHGRSTGAKQIQVRLEVTPALDSAEPSAEFQPIQKFQLSPKQIVSLQSTVASDTFSTTMLLPARIPFGDSAVLRVYAWDPVTRKDGGLASTPRLLRGTTRGGGFETNGPSISVRPCDSSWSGGVSYDATAQIHLPFCLSVDLFDSSGISSETGPDEGVVFSVPGIREPWHPDLRQDVDFRHASAQLVIDSSLMPAGKTYPFEVLARDLMGNLSRSRLQVQVLAKTDYSLYEVFNSPNPVREGENTAFYFKLASEPDTNGTVDSRVQASIRIHTVSGKLVKVLRTELSKVTQPRPRAVWDLRDAFGVPVANGIYPYTVVLRIPNPSGTTTTEIVRKGVVAIGR
jgi:hypothetical protein